MKQKTLIVKSGIPVLQAGEEVKKTLLLRGLVLAWALLLPAWPAATVWADTNPNFNPNVTATTPDDDFTLDDVEGTAYHKKTGLTWKRCAEGQTWESDNCTGTAATCTWSQALQLESALGTFAGFDDWRLPNMKELGSIVERRNFDPAINATVFPNTPGSYFWSASPSIYAKYARGVVFNDGYEDANDKDDYSYAVRLVRGGQYSLLSVTKAGSGSGTVAGSLPGVDCGQFCKGSFANEMFTNGSVILTATPDANSTLGSWTNCPSASGNQCTVSSAGDRTVTATFKANQTITFTNPGPKVFGTTPTLTATASSGLTPSFTSATTGVCTITTGGELAFLSTGDCTINANQAGDATYAAAPEVQQTFTVTQGATTLALINPASVVYGAGILVSVTVTVTGATNPSSPIGTVTVTAGGQTCTATLTAATNPDSTGDCTLTLVPSGDSQTVTATYNGSPVYGGSIATNTVTVTPAATATTLSSSANPAPLGASVTFTATVTSPSAAGHPTTGNMTFTLDGVAQPPVALSGNSATFTVASLTVGNHPLTAVYGATTNYQASTASPDLTQTVDKIATSVALTSSLNPSTVGQSVTVTATVAGTPTPTGTVNFTADGTGVADCSGKNLVNGAATCVSASLSVGSHALAAAYSGDSNSFSSTGNLTQTVISSGGGGGGPTPVNGLCGSANGGTFTNTPTNGLCSVGSASTVSGIGPWTWSCAGSNGGSTASCSTSVQSHTVTTTAGTGGTISPASQAVNHGATAAFTVTANTGYAIDTVTGCGGAMSGTTYTTGAITGPCAVSASFRVQKTTPTVTLRANPGAPDVNQATTITATVRAPNGTTGIPSGNVVISGGGQTCTATLSNGVGSCPLTYASAGNIVLTGAYSGEASFATASGSLTLSIGKVATTATLTSVPNPSIPGQDVTLTATVSATNGSPTGTVAFTESGTAFPGCANVTLSSGTATCRTATLTAGTHPLTAQYSGDATFAASTGSVNQTVSALEPVTVTNPGLPNGVVGIPYAATLEASGGEPPYTYTASGLPVGLLLSPEGLLNGTPLQAESVTVTITVTDAQGQRGEQSSLMSVIG